MGDALAQHYDQKVFATALKATKAGTAGPVTGMGAASNDAIGASPTIADFITACYDAQQHFDENDIPDNDRVLFVTPAVYYDLVEDGRFLNRDFGNNNGSQSDAAIMKVAGLPVIKTNNLAKDWSNGGANDLATERAGAATTDYDVDASNIMGLVLQRQALGAAHLMDISTESEYSVRHQGDLMVSKMANGMKVLRPECLRSIEAAA
jgi:hypothetical protein